VQFEHNYDCPLVLVADDDMAIRFLVKETLEGAGFAVVEVGDGSQVIPAFKKLRPDLVMLDVMMPGMDGFSACAGIRDLVEGYATPIIMMTGLDDVDSVQNAYNAGATDFITKPINWSIMCYRVKYILRSSSAFAGLRLSEARLAEVQSIAKIGSWEINVQTGEMFFSEESYRLLGMEPLGSKIKREHFIAATRMLSKDCFEESIHKTIADGISFCLDKQVVLANGEERHVYAEAHTNRDDAGKPFWTIGYIQDITARKQTEEKIKNLAYFDGLTGLPNRILFRDYFDRAMAVAKRNKLKMAMLFVDLDRFKNVNDSFGHSVGDELLKQVAERLITSIRKNDCVSRDVKETQEMNIARFAGDEFLILLESIKDFSEAAKVANRIKECLLIPYKIQGTEISITPSIGISLYPADGENLDSLIKCADVAMYHAKELGRNNFQFYTNSLNKAAREKLVLESQLRKAITSDELFLCYQPMVDTTNGEIFCVEVLVRWQHPQLGIFSPAQFIPLAEETGLITEIDEWVLHNACKQVKIWQESGLPTFKLSVNISGRHFKKKTLVETIDRVINNSRLDPQWLKLELTEGVLMACETDTLATLMSLKAKGITLSLDDFGTGYSSLSYLKRFPIDVLKIDRSFIKDIITQPDSASITSAIIAMSRSLKLDTVAEGVETREQMNILIENGCFKMQGYLFSRPLATFEFEKFLAGYDASRVW
jgi:diguanylate cyclase (GGDEF)-like protein